MKREILKILTEWKERKEKQTELTAQEQERRNNHV